MRLKISRTAAEEALTAALLSGYRILDEVRRDLSSEQSETNAEESFRSWSYDVSSTLLQIFPTELELFKFRNPNVGVISAVAYSGISIRRNGLLRGIETKIGVLQTILHEDLGRYTGMPIGTRLYIQDIDSFRLVRDINRSMIGGLVNQSGYLDWSEDRVQRAFEEILNVQFHKKDWGGETNDLYTSNIEINGKRRATAFLLKGNGLRKQTMEIADCGKNGDQIVRLFGAPAELFVVQFVGNVSEAIVKDVEDKVTARRSKGDSAYYCIMDGQDTAHLLFAYGKL